MKAYGIEMKGDFIGEKVLSNPAWTSADEGRMIYNETDGYYYYGSDSAWVKVAKDSELGSHANSDGSSHGYIDQDITSGSSPTFDGTNFTSISTAGISGGIGDDNVVKIDDNDVADNDYAKFTATGLEGRSYSEVRTDLNIGDTADFENAL